MTHDKDTKVIGMILEGVKKGDAFRRAVREAQENNKVVIAMHQGRTDVGCRAAALHTGVLATSDAVNSSVLRELGVPRATDLDELYHLGSLFGRYGQASGNGVCVVSISGGAGTLCADLAAYYGMSLPQPSPEATAALKKVLVSYGSAANPMDLTTAVYRNPEMIYSVIMLALEASAYAAVVVPIPFYYPGIIDKVCIEIMRAAAESTKPIVVAWLAQGTDKPARQLLERSGVHVISGSDLCMRVLSKYVAYAPAADAPPISATSVAKPLPTVSGNILQEDVAKTLLAEYGIRVPQERLARKQGDLAELIPGLTAPLALKVISADIIHKAEVGGVRLGIADLAQAETAYTEIVDNIEKACPDASVDGILVQEMAEGFELMLGAKVDPIWGPMVMVGMGGSLAEVLNDIALHTAPLSADAARKLLHLTRAHAAMQRLGYKEEEEVVSAIVAMSRFISDHRHQVANIDANPLMVSKTGAAYLVDAVIELSDRPDAAHG